MRKSKNNKTVLKIVCVYTHTQTHIYVLYKKIFSPMMDKDIDTWLDRGIYVQGDAKLKQLMCYGFYFCVLGGFKVATVRKEKNN